VTELPSTIALRERLERHTAFLESRRDSVPPPLDLRAPEPEPLTRERVNEIGKLLQTRTFLSAFGVSPLELAEFVAAARRGVKA